MSIRTTQRRRKPILDIGHKLTVGDKWRVWGKWQRIDRDSYGEVVIVGATCGSEYDIAQLHYWADSTGGVCVRDAGDIQGIAQQLVAMDMIDWEDGE